MSRHKKKRGGANAAQTAEVSILKESAWMSGYAGANWSPDRGLLDWWTLDSRLDLDSFSRWELVRRSKYLFANVGFVRGIVRNGAVLVGNLTPQARTGDREWNRKAEQLFRDRAGTAAAFDRQGKFNFWTAQTMLTRQGFVDGDILTVRLATQSGAARVAFIEAPQVQTPDRTASENWSDGVLLDSAGRHMAYGIRNYSSDTVSVIDARDAIYFGEFDASGHVRAIPKLAHAINHATDITEIRSFTKKAIKNASLMGTVREVDGGAAPTKSSRGMGGTLREVMTQGGQKIEVLDIWGSGQNNELPPGHKVKVLHDERPHQNQQQFLDVLARDISIGFGLPLEVVWQMSGLTGPGVRFVMDLASRWIESRQQTLEAWCRDVWNWIIAKEISSGRLGLPKGDRGWWAVEFIPQRDLTVDRGRDGKQALEELDRGAGTLADFSRTMKGRDWDDQLYQRVTEIRRAQEICDELKVPYERAFPPRAGAAATEKAETPEPDPKS